MSTPSFRCSQGGIQCLCLSIIEYFPVKEEPPTRFNLFLVALHSLGRLSQHVGAVALAAGRPFLNPA